MSAPLVSVCIPAFNHEKYIGAAIESVLAQTMGDFEIIVTDDASTDRTAEIARSYQDPRIRTFRLSRNSGPGAASNNNFDHARGTYVAPLASDDMFVPEKLARQVSFMEENGRVGAVFSWMTYVAEDGAEFDVPRSTAAIDLPNRPQAEWLRHLFFSGNPFSAPTAMIRRDLLRAVGPVDPRLLQVQDFDLWIRMCLRADMHILPERLLRYRIRDHAANASANTPQQQARTFWEFTKLYGHFRHASPALFDAAFGEDVPEAARHLPRDAQLALMALSTQNPLTRSFGLDLAYSLLGDPACAGAMAAAGFDHPWLFRISAEVDPFQIVPLEWFKQQLQNWQAAHAEAVAAYEQARDRLADLETARAAS